MTCSLPAPSYAGDLGTVSLLWRTGERLAVGLGHAHLSGPQGPCLCDGAVDGFYWFVSGLLVSVSMNPGIGWARWVGVAILHPLGSFELPKVQSCALTHQGSLRVCMGMGCDTKSPRRQVLTGEQHLLLSKGLSKEGTGRLSLHLLEPLIPES